MCRCFIEVRTIFTEQGYLDPISILSRAEAHRLYRELKKSGSDSPLDWPKGWAAAARDYYAAGCHPQIVSKVTELLGPDVLLWGARLISMPPGARHAWHSDLESSCVNGKTVSVWLALHDCCRDSSLHLITGSQNAGKTVQEVRASRNAEHAAEKDEDVQNWARQFLADSHIEIAECQDGDALFFDGRLWHGSHNTSPLTRSALLLQYATPDTPIRIPSRHSWPYKNLEQPLPPCVMISGRDDYGVNRIVNAPAASGPPHAPRLTTQARELEIPFVPDNGHWMPVPVFQGKTAGQRNLSCHVSALEAGHSPHPPHKHPEEEILMILHGEANVILPDLDGELQQQRLQKGDCVYYPAQFPHTIEGVSSEPVNYLMLKWIADPSGCKAPMGFRRWTLNAPSDIDEKYGYNYNILFGESTHWLHKLQCHTTAMLPGAGYAPHVDGYDVVMIILDGTLESIGKTLAPYGVFFYASGELHGASNPGSGTAHYVVFEFHARPGLLQDGQKKVPFLKKITDPRKWRKFLGHKIRKLRFMLSGTSRRHDS